MKGGTLHVRRAACDPKDAEDWEDAEGRYTAETAEGAEGAYTAETAEDAEVRTRWFSARSAISAVRTNCDLKDAEDWEGAEGTYTAETAEDAEVRTPWFSARSAISAVRTNPRFSPRAPDLRDSGVTCPASRQAKP
jgi:hypothetical protein